MSTALQIGGSLFSMMGASDAADAAEVMGQRARQAADFRAAQLRSNAGQAIAASQRAGDNEVRRANLLASRALAVAAASGGGASDPTVVKLISNIAGEGTYRRLSAMYEGEERARAMRMQADAASYEGAIAEEAGYMKADSYRTQGMAGLFKMGGSLFEKYGGNGPGLVGEMVPGQFSLSNPAFG